MQYIGPVSKKGLKIKGRLYKEPWNWKEDEAKSNIEKEPELEKFFKIEDKAATTKDNVDKPKR